MLTRIRNAASAKRSRVDMPASTLKVEIARILQDEGYIQGYKIVEETPEGARTPQKFVRIFLKYGSARRARDHRDRAHQPPGPARLLRRTTRCPRCSPASASAS